jgi:GntP family gluconate:H+ symporter
MWLIAGILILALLMMVATLAYYRWHPILALLACSLLVASLTPTGSVVTASLRDKAWRAEVESEQQLRILHSSRTPSSGTYRILSIDPYAAFTSTSAAQAISIEVLAIDPIAANGDWNAQVKPATDFTQLNGAGPSGRKLWLMDESQWKASQQTAKVSAIERISKGLGNTCEKIGIMILLASIIGSCLIASGAAQRIVSWLSELLGQSRVTLALVISGFILGIPVFFDTVFLLLLPVALSYARSTGKNYLLVIMSVVVGATMAHSLVPPTPGPLQVANALQIDIATAMLMGTIVGGSTATIGWLTSRWLDRVWPIIPNELPKGENAESTTSQPSMPLWLALSPIVLPMFFLAGHAMVEAFDNSNLLMPQVSAMIDWLGQKEVALALATVFAIYGVFRNASAGTDVAKVIQEGLTVGGTVLLVTSAGGAFGDTIRQTDVAGILSDNSIVPQSGLGLLVTAFVITALVRVLQGSATVAMFTAIGLVQPWVNPETLQYHPVYLALAIGCGSKMCPWMNDSGFWLVARMAGLTPTQTLRSFSLVLSIMGLAGLGAVLCMATLLPLK